MTSGGSTIVFFPEGAFGPTNNCVGIGDVLRARGHRVVFILEESFAGTLEAQGFEERLMRLTPPPETEEVPGQFWKEFECRHLQWPQGRHLNWPHLLPVIGWSDCA